MFGLERVAQLEVVNHWNSFPLRVFVVREFEMPNECAHRSEDGRQQVREKTR